MKKILFAGLICAGSLGIGGIYVASVSASPVPSPIAAVAAALQDQHDSPINDSDVTQAEDPASLLIEQASEGYKSLKFMQYDGVAPSELYPEVKKVYSQIMSAWRSESFPESERSRFKAMLTDISHSILQGAFHYSSEGNSELMAEFSTDFVDIRRLPEMQDVALSGEVKNIYPALVYSAASSAYNRGDYEKAIDYFEEYLSTDAKDRREQVSTFLAQACINAGCPQRGIDRLIAAVDLYPSNTNLLLLTLQCCLDGNYYDRMQPLLNKALILRPGDPQLLNLQGRLLENEGNFADALTIFSQLDELMPDNMGVNRHLALCYYNLGADYYNKSLMESDDKASKRYRRQSDAYFNTAVDRLYTVVENDPSNTKYLRALAFTYGCLGRSDKLQEINTRLMALGQNTIAMNGMPESIAFAEQKDSDSSTKGGYAPDYQEFAKAYVERHLAGWAERREFEKSEEYQKRVSQDNFYNQYQKLCKEAEAEYLKKYASRLRISDLRLQPYDSDNETYLIKSDFGDIVLNVPYKNREAETFKNSWSTIQIKNPHYYIKDNNVAIASIDFITSAGKKYSYNAAGAADYDFTDVRLDVDSFMAQANSRRNDNAASGDRNKTKVIRAASDVDRNIPYTSRSADKTVALIMANENYKNVSDVTAALNDGETFAKYCNLTLGIPKSQVLQFENLTYAEMVGAINKLRQLVNALGDGVDIIVYYAGHGFPDESSKDAYLLPVDGDGYTTVVSYPLKKFYDELSGMRAENVMVFLDACFSGATRDGGMLAEARGIALKPREATPDGNMYVLSAASDQQTALPYVEKNHGMFTYFLLKKLQESKGNVTLKDLSNYVEDNVRKNSLTVNGKLQTPTTKVSGRLADEWTSKKLRP